uniref:MAM domain-containing protein n=1 Tax=Macrostomum lignano TaxID=282301 RepID=A0A1I8FAV7_9PLAT
TECQLRYRIHSGRQQLLTQQAVRVNSGTQRARRTLRSSALRIFRLCVRTPSSFAKASCHANSISVYDGFTAADRQRKDFQPVCDNLADWTLMAATRRLVVRLTAKNLEHLPLLQLAVTAVRIGPCQSDTEFDCGAGRCIDSRLRATATRIVRTSRTKEATVLAGAPVGGTPSATFVGFAVTERRQEQGQRDDAACGTPTSEPANGSVRLLSETKLWRQSPSRYVGSSRRLLYPCCRLEATGAAVPCANATATAAAAGLLFQPEPGSLAYLDPGSLTNNLTARQQHQIWRPTSVKRVFQA